MESPIAMSFIDKLTKKQFINFTEHLLINLGYKHVHLASTTIADDYNGINILCLNNKGKKIGISCRNNKYISQLDFSSIIMDSIGYSLDESIILTNTYLTNNSLKFCKKHNIMLIDRDKLLELIKDIVINYKYIFIFAKTIDLRRELKMNISKLKKLYKEQSYSFNKYDKDLNPASLRNYFKN